MEDKLNEVEKLKSSPIPKLLLGAMALMMPLSQQLAVWVFQWVGWAAMSQ